MYTRSIDATIKKTLSRSLYALKRASKKRLSEREREREMVHEKGGRGKERERKGKGGGREEEDYEIYIIYILDRRE